MNVNSAPPVSTPPVNEANNNAQVPPQIPENSSPISPLQSDTVNISAEALAQSNATPRAVEASTQSEASAQEQASQVAQAIRADPAQASNAQSNITNNAVKSILG